MVCAVCSSSSTKSLSQRQIWRYCQLTTRKPNGRRGLPHFEHRQLAHSKSSPLKSMLGEVAATALPQTSQNGRDSSRDSRVRDMVGKILQMHKINIRQACRHNESLSTYASRVVAAWCACGNSPTERRKWLGWEFPRQLLFDRLRNQCTQNERIPQTPHSQL
jgi:hypothetical protein